MRKALVPMLVCLTLCGTATATLIVTTARAQTPHQPALASLVPPALLQVAANTPPPPTRGRAMRAPADRAGRLQQLCQDRYARQAGRLAYLEARLALTSAQQPLFQRWKKVESNIARRQQDACAQRPKNADDAPTPAARITRAEDRLKKRLADLQAQRPVLQALYAALTPAQRALLEPRHARMAQRMRGRSQMRRGPNANGPNPNRRGRPAPAPQ